MAYYEPGRYECIIRSQGFELSKEKKTPCFWLSFMPITSEGDGAYSRTVQLWLTDKTIDNVVARLRTLGWEGTSFKDLEPGGFTFIGKTVWLRCDHEQHDDRIYEKWEFPPPEGSGQQAENVDGVARKLDALFGKALKGGKVSMANAAYSEPAAAKADRTRTIEQDEIDGGDEVPF